MQPPPQAGPAGTGGPPRMGMTTTPYWRKRTPPPSAMAPPPVQPVTDPFAFGRMTPQNVPPTTVPKAPILATPSPSPSLYPQPAALASSHGDGAQASLPMGAVTSYSNVPTPPVQSGNFTNNMASPPIGQLTLGHSTGSSLQNVAGGLENAYGPLPGRSQNMDMNSSSSIAPPLQSHPSSANQQTTAPWSSTQATPPTSSQHVPAAQHPAYTAPYYSPPYLEVSHLPPQNSDPSYFSAPQRTAPATFPLGGGSGQVQQHGISPYSSVMHTDYMQNQNPDHISWFNPPHPEPLKQAQPPHTMQTGTLHNAIQTGAPGPLPNTIQTMAGAPLPSTIQTGTPAPLANTIQTRALAPLPYTIQTRAPAPLSSPNTIQTGAPFSALENRPQSEPAGSLDQATSDTDSGTISMFFKGDEAENVEIPSTDQQHMPRNQSMDTAYHQNLGCQGSMHPFTDLPAAPNMASLLPLHPSAQQTSLFQSASGFHDSHVPGKAGDTENQPTEARAGSELPYDNVENIEVLPNEPPNSSLISSGGIPETFRYGPVLGSALPKSTVGRPEGGPNLEAPDALPHPVRSDSVSSNYSNLSHRSLPTSVRPQELEGTFIQKEIGRLERESSTGFFKQIDSSPLTGDVITHGMTQNPYHGSLSQPPTPSPPKPTGIFQASVNSSFEPVRSQAGVKAAEVDQSKVVDVRENQKLPPTSSHSAGLAASPGNLEQPPDNLETIFSGKSNAEICAVNSGHHFPTGTMLDNISLLLEKRPSSRAHGSNKKCESPATTLWAQGELPNFGGNVLLAPPAPALYVPPKPQTEVIQPPEDGSLEVHPGRPDQSQFSASPEEHTSSENLENPPKIGDDEHTQSQVTKDVQAQPSVETSRPGPGAAPEYMAPASYPPAPSVQTIAGANKPSAYPQQTGAHVPSSQNPAGLPYSGTAEPAAKYSHPEHPPYPTQPATSTSAAVNPMQPAGYPDPARPPASHTPQQADPYYYYQGYGAYPSAYQPPYPTVDPRASHLYYQDSYGAYDPAYRQYSNSSFVNPAKYYQEPERPSSRSSHCSDRPPSRQGYTAPANYYDYYQSQYEYGDPTRWDRYPGAYDPGYRDPRNNYWNYTYREDAYGRKVPYAYTSRYDVYEDRWQYDPRYVGGFDDEPDARRDLTKDDFDRRSVHSEHSARSVHSEHSTHSRRSSFSSRSQQSQVYKSEQDLAANAYGGQVPNPPLEDYSYSLYPNDYSTQQSLDSYQYSYPVTSEWQPVEQVPSRSLTPEKFGSPHVCARFGPGGHLIKVLPNLPSDGQPTLVEIHNMEVIMQNSPEQEQMRGFPGPLVKDETHKVDVINFAQNKAKECSQNENLLDKESARLLWDFIVLMCRQNGTVVGTDIAELLLQDHKTVWLPGKSPNEANLIDFTNEPLELEEESVASQLSFLTDTLPNSGVVIERETERFRELLLFGRKKDALESAMKHGLWGHALLLSSKMDSRTHARVMTRFANSLPINDPLQTVYQLLSGRMPAAATCCGDEKWGDWRPHLAMVLSNLTSNVDVPTRTIVTMGDTLASRGLLEAAHFCYVMAQAGFGVYTKKTTKLVLIGSNHSLPFAKFATNEAIQRTEAYEYAQSLGAQTFSLPNIQVFKFIYACRLAEYGLSAQAFHYCEVISKTVVKHPSYYSPVLVGQLLEVSSHLRFFDPQLKEKPEQELFVEPPWLLRLRHLDMQMKQGSVVYNTGRTTPQQYACSTPSSEQDLISQSEGIAATHEGPAASDNPLLTNFLPNVVPNQGVQLALPGPDHTAALYPPPEPPSSFPPQTFLPSLAPPAAGQGPVPVSSESVAAYTPAPMGSVPSPLQPAEFISQEQWIQDPALQRPPTNSPTKTTFYDSGFDFYGEMAKMAPGQRSRTVSQSSSHMRRTRTISESSTHSVGSTRRSSIGVQPSPPPIPEMKKPEPKKEPKPSSSSQGSGRSWLGWLMRKGKNEAHLPDDRNKSIVWDEAKQRWINLDEPEGEENKPLPPPPSSMPKLQAQVPSGPGGLSAPPNSSVNMFSIKAGGARTRYVDVLNPGGNKPTTSVLPPADLFAPLAPIPTNLFVPNAVPEEAQPPVGSEAEMAQLSDQPGIDGTAQTQFLNAAPGLDLLATNHEDVPSGELSRSSSQSSLSREVSQHFHQVFAAGRHSFSVFFPSFLHLFCTNVACFLSHPS
ncbi:protein transport protein Sec16A isoform X3 [Bufo gargarizans]|uniref:protein transport protein Sec16A isoform X3 n=1 Tax=Bufo gargarizans TaxID=30331 RepID=UPI001CF567FA|nr:protein transport protein Sec16A isoform X3 [Bufo gargarizans]